MAGALRKMGLYLGIVEDDEGAYDEYDEYEADEQPGRRPGGAHAATASSVRPIDDRTGRLPAVDSYRAPGPQRAPERAADAAEATYRITTLHPRTYNEARTIGDARLVGLQLADEVPREVEVSELGGLAGRLLVAVLAEVADAELGEDPRVGGRPGLRHRDQRDLVGRALGNGARDGDALADRRQVGRDLLGPAHAGSSQTTAANRPVAPERR